jgi:hypothetical protein
MCFPRSLYVVNKNRRIVSEYHFVCPLKTIEQTDGVLAYFPI